MEGREPFICGQCGVECDLRFTYDLELESGVYAIEWFHCPVCRGDFLNSPELLTGEELITPSPDAVGPAREAVLCHGTQVKDSAEPGGHSLEPLIETVLADGFADAAILPDYGRQAGALIVTDPEEVGELRRAWATRGRSFFVNAGLEANFDFLLELERFARQDGGNHPRIAVAGKPCHVYAARRANMERIAPGYEVRLALGLFCYGNVQPLGSTAMRFRELTGLSPTEIRGITATAGLVRVVGSDRRTIELPLSDFASFLHRSCLKCVDFTVPWADMSLGESPQIEGFDVAIVRTEAGEKLFHRALDTGRLRVWSPPWMTPEGDIPKILADLTAVKRAVATLDR
ncbi:MAG TPA: Coenzyme F420 hydrogenase/dehydrogenase, beta subunit C-terminal domain [Thermoplasmata archaeon]|nr:Coenzyme F420 hydrogenase/dehydrogenase, beta subunit C-terminal domain [Thermoplasmata archaeon]HLA46400.1 Coenzyme F420 hydrogenase/dehydrogenase, beta subunit C-terminal domain [Thermoplasmata archaeon]